MSPLFTHGDLETMMKLIKKYFQLFESVFIEFLIPKIIKSNADKLKTMFIHTNTGYS